jgi:ketosteroid isomerase-like protein
MCFLSFDKRFKKIPTVLCCQIQNIMTQTKFHPTTRILSLAFIIAFCFAGRSISSLPAWPNDRMAEMIDSVSDDIRNIEWQYKEALMKGDSALFLKCYTPDACILPPNAPALCGQWGLSQFFKGTRRAGVRDATFTSIGLFGQTWEYVTQQGAVELFDAGQHSLGKAKVLIVWKKTDEGWRIFRHMLNFDAPMPAPASSVK